MPGNGAVSIRTPRAGRDIPALESQREVWVSIRTPRAGRDKCKPDIMSLRKLFLSARPGRGATTDEFSMHLYLIVSIRTPRAGRDVPTTATPAT